MKTPKNDALKPTAVKVNKELDKYLEKGLFKEKLDKANAILRKGGLPKVGKA